MLMLGLLSNVVLSCLVTVMIHKFLCILYCRVCPDDGNKADYFRTGGPRTVTVL